MMPCSDTRPIVGLIPVRFCALDGAVIEPPVWVPMPEAAIRPATAVAVPVDEPPGSVFGLVGVHALTVVTTPSGVVARVVASGPICVLPSTIPPAALSRATAVASNGGTKSRNRYELAVVCTPAV
jgi:hypothetical protein